MIQRIQSVYLLLAVLLNGATFFTPIWLRAIEDPSKWTSSAYLAAAGMASLLSLFSIFQFKNRPGQISWIKRAALFQVLISGVAFGIVFSLGGIGLFLWDEALSAALFLLALLLQILAIRGVRKDDDLVRSMDRIR